jgi:dienelactone hydrolase
MAEVLLFHHAQGQTKGFHELADQLRAAGHTVHAPDLYDGRTFDDLEQGVGYARELGFDALADRGVAVAEELPPGLVYVGLSLGVVPAQRLAQTRPGARGAVLLHACLPSSEFGGWPAGVPVQVHGMDADPFFADEGDLDAAKALIEETGEAELFVYPGDQHLFSDSSLPAYDAAATDLMTKRLLGLLDRVTPTGGSDGR